MAMPPGPPQDAEAPQMDPQQAQQVLAKFNIKPEDVPMVMAACEALEPPEADGGAEPPHQVQGSPPGGLMAALGQRFQG